MSLQELKIELAALSESERDEIAAFLFHLRHASDPDYLNTVRNRLEDKNPSHWLTLDELEKGLDRQ